MKKISYFIFSCLLLLMSPSTFAEEAPQSVKDLATKLTPWGKNPTLIQAVKTQNAENLTLDTIKKRDKVWRETSGVDDMMKGMMESAAAKAMYGMEKSEPFYTELFLMDNQGANVAMTNKTSDYWQGDEAKFQKSYNNGAGAIHIGDVEFDESAQAYLVQVSVPVVDGDKVIGAITIGVNLDELEAQ